MMKMVNLANIPDEDDKQGSNEISAYTPMYPYGLCICLDDEVLKKLGLGLDDFKVGSTIYITGMAGVTSASERETQDGGLSCRVELQIQSIGVENENEEVKEVEHDSPKPRRKPDLKNFYNSDY